MIWIDRNHHIELKWKSEGARPWNRGNNLPKLQTVRVYVMEIIDSQRNRCLQSIDIGTNRNVEDVVWNWIAFQVKPESSRFLWRHDGEHCRKAVSNKRQTRVKTLKFEVGKGLLDWNSLIAIGD
jgi:hypothetical protein